MEKIKKLKKVFKEENRWIHYSKNDEYFTEYIQILMTA